MKYDQLYPDMKECNLTHMAVAVVKLLISEAIENIYLCLKLGIMICVVSNLQSRKLLSLNLRQDLS